MAVEDLTSFEYVRAEGIATRAKANETSDSVVVLKNAMAEMIRRVDVLEMRLDKASLVVAELRKEFYAYRRDESLTEKAES